MNGHKNVKICIISSTQNNTTIWTFWANNREITPGAHHVLYISFLLQSKTSTHDNANIGYSISQTEVEEFMCKVKPWVLLLISRLLPFLGTWYRAVKVWKIHFFWGREILQCKSQLFGVFNISWPRFKKVSS